MATRDKKLNELIEPVIKALGCGLWGLEFTGQGRHSLLRVYLEKVGGVDINDCAEVSKQISSILDVENPISGEYTLEVSSPGLDRQLFNLNQFEAYVGHMVLLKLTEAFEGRRKFKGLLKAVINEEVVLVSGDVEYTLPYELIDKANIDLST